MRGDAVVARAQDRVVAVEPIQGVAAATGRALVAAPGGVVEVRAAGALEKVAAGRGLVAELLCRPREQRDGEHGVTRAHAPLRGQRAVRHLRSNAQPAVFRVLDLGER